MKSNELVHKLSAHTVKEVYVKVEGGLFYPIKDIKLFDGNIIILCENIVTSVESCSFEPAKFEKPAK